MQFHWRGSQRASWTARCSRLRRSDATTTSPETAQITLVRCVYFSSEKSWKSPTIISASSFRKRCDAWYGSSIGSNECFQAHDRRNWPRRRGGPLIETFVRLTELRYRRATGGNPCDCQLLISLVVDLTHFLNVEAPDCICCFWLRGPYNSGP